LPLRILIKLLPLLIAATLLLLATKMALAIAPIVEACYGSYCARITTGNITTLKVLTNSIIKVKIANTNNQTLYYTIYINNHTVAYGAVEPNTLVTKCITILSKGRYSMKIVLGNYTYRITIESFNSPIKLLKEIYYVPYGTESYLILKLLQNIPIKMLYLNGTKCTCTNATCMCILKIFENTALPHNATLNVEAVDYANVVSKLKLKIMLIPIVRVAKIRLKHVEYRNGVLTICIYATYCSPYGTVNLSILVDEKNVTETSIPCGRSKCISIPILLLPGQHVVVLESSNYIVAGTVYKILYVRRQLIQCSIYGQKVVQVLKKANFLIMFPHNVNGLLRVLVYNSHGRVILEKVVHISNNNVVKFNIIFNRSGMFNIVSLFESSTSIGRCAFNVTVTPLSCEIRIFNKSIISSLPFRYVTLVGKILLSGVNGVKNLHLVKVMLLVDSRLVGLLNVRPGNSFTLRIMFNSSGLHNVTLVTYCKDIVKSCHASVLVNVTRYSTHIVAVPDKHICVVGSRLSIRVKICSKLNKTYNGSLRAVIHECGRVLTRFFKVNSSLLNIAIVPKCAGVIDVELQYMGDSVHASSNTAKIVVIAVPGVLGVPLTHLVATAVTVILGYYVSNLVTRRREE